jgi:hypothetical protein
LLKYIFILSTLILMLLIGCANTGEKVEASLGEEFSLQIGQIAQIDKEELEIRFEKVLADSRCPKGVTCIWAGQVRCQLRIKDKEAWTDLEIVEPGLTNPPSLIINRAYKIFYHIQPYPEAGKEITPDEYQLILKVETN